MNTKSQIITIKTLFNCASSREFYEKISQEEKVIFLQGNRAYFIPGYQREIRWNKQNIITLITDLRKSEKFLGIIVLSTNLNKESIDYRGNTSEKFRYDIIDGQQRITVLYMLLTALARRLGHKNDIDLVLINKTFPKLTEAMDINFDDTKHSEYDEITSNDDLNQISKFKEIWLCIDDELNKLDAVELENLSDHILDSDVNILVETLDREQKSRQNNLCVDYFIDINNKSVVLDGLDILKAYIFKYGGFDEMSKKWVQLSQKIIKLKKLSIKYPITSLFQHYFLCSVNNNKSLHIKDIDEDFVAYDENNKLSHIGLIISDKDFYTRMMNGLLEFLDFIELVLKQDNDSSYDFKQLFLNFNEKKALHKDTYPCVLYIIKSILKCDDTVPKVLIMKYFFSILKFDNPPKDKYKIIYYINVIATLFSISRKRKSLSSFSSIVTKDSWEEEIRNRSKKEYENIDTIVAYDKFFKSQNVCSEAIGQYYAERAYILMDSYYIINNEIKCNKLIFSNHLCANYNMDHFFITNSYKFEITLNRKKETFSYPKKIYKYIRTIGNFLLMNKEENNKLGNTVFWEKLDRLKEYDEVIDGNSERKVSIPHPIFGECSLSHYKIAKDIFSKIDNNPKQQLCLAKTNKEAEKILKDYFKNRFPQLYIEFINRITSEDKNLIYKIKKSN